MAVRRILSQWVKARMAVPQIPGLQARVPMAGRPAVPPWAPAHPDPKAAMARPVPRAAMAHPDPKAAALVHHAPAWAPVPAAAGLAVPKRLN